MSIVIRAYERSDAADTLAVFISAVTETASADYTAEQVQAWAQPERRDVGNVEAQARREGTPTLSTDASITARPFFERHGFTVETEQHPVKAGVELTNYKMRKKLRCC